MRWLDDDEQRHWRDYIQGSMMLQDRLDRELRLDHGISLQEYEVLVQLSESPDRSIRMATLARNLCHSRSRLSHTVARLEKVGLVSRCPAERDRRGIQARLTDAGYAALVDAAPTHVRGVREHLIDLAEKADFAAVGKVMRAVHEHLLDSQG